MCKLVNGQQLLRDDMKKYADIISSVCAAYECEIYMKTQTIVFRKQRSTMQNAYYSTFHPMLLDSNAFISIYNISPYSIMLYFLHF